MDTSNTPPKQKDDLASLSEMLIHTSWKLRKSGKDELHALGITFAQFRALRILNHYSCPVPMNELAARLEVVPRTVTTTIDILEEAGLVQRTPNPDDRRSTLISPTKAGADLLSRVAGKRRETSREFFERLDATEQKELLKLLKKLTGREEA